jgi:hypothetical protein
MLEFLAKVFKENRLPILTHCFSQGQQWTENRIGNSLYTVGSNSSLVAGAEWRQQTSGLWAVSLKGPPNYSK